MRFMAILFNRYLVTQNERSERNVRVAEEKERKRKKKHLKAFEITNEKSLFSDIKE
jgi:hypothetical protein